MVPLSRWVVNKIDISGVEKYGNKVSCALNHTNFRAHSTCMQQDTY